MIALCHIIKFPIVGAGSRLSLSMIRNLAKPAPNALLISKNLAKPAPNAIANTKETGVSNSVSGGGGLI